MYWLDVTGIDPSVLPTQKCCRLRKLSSVEALPDLPIGKFCSALAMILAETKLDDDIRDNSSVRGRLLKTMLASRLHHGQDYFKKLAPEFNDTITGYIDGHLLLEKDQVLVPFRQYVKPTSDAFGYLFSLLALLPDMGDEKVILDEIGQHVGASLIAFDCASDWHRDRKSGDFNPLLDVEQVEASVEYSKQSLRQAKPLCESRFGNEAATVKLLGDVENSIAFQPRNTNSVSDCLDSKPLRVGAIGGASALLAGASDANDNSGIGACCCLLIGAAIASSACGSKRVTATEGSDCCGNKTTTFRKSDPCDC